LYISALNYPLGGCFWKYGRAGSLLQMLGTRTIYKPGNSSLT
jgi:hypothetical protein